MGGLPGPGATLIAVTIYAGNYLLIGLGIWLLAIALGMAHEIDYAMATSAFALSWILGFLAPGAPAGLGAREGLMVLILQRSDERRVGKECVSTCRYRWSTYH